MSEHLFDLFRLELLADLAPEYLGRLSGYYVFYGIYNSPLCYTDVCCIEIVLIETMSFIYNRIRKKKRKLVLSEWPYFPFYPEQPSHGNYPLSF